MELELTELMIFFDDFFESFDSLNNEKTYVFFAERRDVKVELTYYAISKKIALITSFKNKNISSVVFKFCDYVKLESINKQLVIISKYNDSLKYIKCDLFIKDYIYLYINPNF